MTLNVGRKRFDGCIPMRRIDGQRGQHDSIEISAQFARMLQRATLGGCIESSPVERDCELRDGRTPASNSYSTTPSE